jgi:hypothetical protein
LSARTLVAIHQPNFFPWLGFFDKIARSDVFILMDNAQFQKKGGCWTNRVKMRVSGEPQWVTAPVVRSYHGTLPIAEVLLDESTLWRDKLWRTIETNYGSATHFAEMRELIGPLVAFQSGLLAEYNENAVRTIAEALGITASVRIAKGTELHAEGKATDLLISMVAKVGGNAYLAGGGAEGYQEDEKFTVAGMGLIRQEFEHPTYAQTSDAGFVAGLSVIDALANCGIDGTAALLSRRTPRGEGR